MQHNSINLENYLIKFGLGNGLKVMSNDGFLRALTNAAINVDYNLRGIFGQVLDPQNTGLFNLERLFAEFKKKLVNTNYTNTSEGINRYQQNITARVKNTDL